MVFSKKRAGSLLLALALCLGTVACSQSPASESGSASGSSSGSSSGTEGGIPEIELTGETNVYGWEVPKETISFAYYSASDSTVNQDEENERIQAVTSLYEEEFNLKIQKIVYKQDPTERLNLMLTGNEYPDAIVGMPEAMASTFISQERAVELTPYLDKYGQGVYDALGKYVNLMKEEDGSLYKMPYTYGHTTDFLGQDFSIRNDLLKKAGLDYPESFEEYYEAMKTILEQNPTNENGEKAYAFTAFSAKGEEFYQAPLALLGFYGSPTGYYKMDDEGTITHWVDTEEGLWVAKYINQFWRDGMIDPDFQTKDYDQSVAFMSSERVYGNLGTWWYNRVGAENVWSATEPDWTVEKRMQNIVWETEGYTPRTIRDNFVGSSRSIITDKAEHPEWIVKYWDWETTPLAFELLRHGPMDTGLWTVNEDGDIVEDEKMLFGDPEDPNWTYNDAVSKNGGFSYVMMVPGATPEHRVEDPSEGWADPVEAVNLWGGTWKWELVDQSKMTPIMMMELLPRETEKPYLWDQTIWTVNWSSDDPTYVTYTDIKEAIVADWIKVVMAESEEQCEQYFNEMKEHLRSLGLDDVTAYQQECVTANRTKLEG